MHRFFNIAGPCYPQEHYIVPPLERLPDLTPLINQKQYFVIHAARQTGKTTLLHHLAAFLNGERKYYALYCPLEAAQVFPEPREGIRQIFYSLTYNIKNSGLPHAEDFGKGVKLEETAIVIRSALSDYCRILDKPLVLLFDEIDALQNGTLVAFLRQLREGYITRNTIPFPHSVALVGLRNIRDYKSRLREARQTLGSASPFNIVAEAFTLSNFTHTEMKAFYGQHTQATKQLFESSAVEKAYEYSSGQPWLVNAIAREIIVKILGNDYSKPVTSSLVEQAVQNIMLRRDTHIDSLLDKLKEERVRKVLDPLIAGQESMELLSDDVQYCLDLGLVKDGDTGLVPANKIYAEVIIRTLSYDSQYNFEKQIPNIWITPNGQLDMNGLMKAFQQFWRENSEIWEEKYDYKEAAPHLILQAFLQRIVNGGGSILREYAGGRKRMDLCVRYGDHQYPIEIKIQYGAKTIPEGLAQLSEYMDKLGEKTGWLIVFDRKKSKSWDEKVFWKTEKTEGKTVYVAGC